MNPGEENPSIPKDIRSGSNSLRSRLVMKMWAMFFKIPRIGNNDWDQCLTCGKKINAQWESDLAGNPLKIA